MRMMRLDGNPVAIQLNLNGGGASVRMVARSPRRIGYAAAVRIRRGAFAVRCEKGNGAVNSSSGSGSAEVGGVRMDFDPVEEEFESSEIEGDPDRPSEGFSSVAEALEAFKQGKMVIVVDDEDRENEGDLIMAASMVTPEKVEFLRSHCTGIICVPMKGEILDRLDVKLMVSDKENEEALSTAFTIPVDGQGTTTGVSSEDRARTISMLASPNATASDFKKPGHVYPLRYREGGVLKRAGHTEAAVDLAVLSGMPPVGVICELVNEKDGSMQRLPQLQVFAEKHNLHIISIADMVRYRRKREKLVERTAISRLPTRWGLFKAYSYKSKLDGIEHIAIVKGDIGNGRDVLVRVHSECLTGDVFGSKRCDCGNQLEIAMMQIEKAGRGVLVYLRGHEGRGIGLGHKLRAYNLQDEGRDTVEANVELGLPVDSREYGIGAQILRDVGVRTMKLMTNNPAKYMGLKGYGLAITGRVSVISTITDENKRYLETKREKMGHVYGSELPGTFTGLIADKVNGKKKSQNAL
ncbi:probable bifunctional riboflavin biosynthesis protein RIBA 1, chloroplastic [Selaginella moellendorffii]|nr:probable bifunctional riboflavin biosynthesis protein RIBA 1, chloroplastic [Selaginella moellendorffii]|eukprot:XP_002962016.2 probable bifunctional riboflavin biosynthesis protein RIBA 1, chloroplastic [Selaginella moellendorffii]